MTQYTREDIAKAVADEREACANMCEDMGRGGLYYSGENGSKDTLRLAARKIRSRVDQPEASPQAPTDADPPGIDYPLTPRQIVQEAARDLNALGIKAKEIRIKWHDAIGAASQPAEIEIEADL